MKYFFTAFIALSSVALRAQISTPTQTDEIINIAGSPTTADPLDTIRYTVTITATSAATNVQLNVVPDPLTTFVPSTGFRSSPVAVDDGVSTPYLCIGNVGIIVPDGASDLLANDFDDNIGALTLSCGTCLSANGGNVTVANDGSFTYKPAPGFEGNDQFTYTITDGTLAGPGAPTTNTATVFLTVSEVIWFVDENAGSNGDGRLGTPFSTLPNFVSGAADQTEDIIFLYESATSYTGGITLLNNQKLIGQDATVSLASATGLTVPTFSNALPATNSGNGTFATITNAGGDGVNLAMDNTLRGFTVGASSDFGIENTAAASVGNLAISEVSINNTTGGGFSASHGGAMNVVFSSISSTGGTHGMNVVNATGTFTVNGGTVTNSSGTTVVVSGGSVIFNNSGNITDNAGLAIHIDNHDSGNVTFQTGDITSTGSGISVTNSNGGTIAFNNPSKSLTTTTNTAVNLTNNTGATINFTNGGLVINTTGGTGFNATGGATAVTVQGTGNKINNTTGPANMNTATALNVTSTTIGASGLTFESISSGNNTVAADPANGIVLNNTGTSGGLVVSGDGTMTAGGNSTGGTIQNTTGDAVILNTTSGITLRNMTITNPAGDGLDADQLIGTNLFQSLSISAFNTGMTDGITVVNTVNFTSITVDKVHIFNSVTGNDGFNYNSPSTGSAAGTVNITNSEFNGLDGDGVQIINDGGGTITTTISGNNLHDADNTGGGNFNTLSLSLGGTGILNATVSGNTFNNVARVLALAGVIGISAAGAGTNSSSDLNVTISNNTIQNSTGRRGISIILEASGTLPGFSAGHDITITNNSIQNITNRQGIYIAVSALSSRDNQNNDITISNNMIGNVMPVGGTTRGGIVIELFDDFVSSVSDLEADLLIQNNTVVVSSSDASLRLSPGAGVIGSTINLEASVLGNTFTNNGTGFSLNVELGYFADGTNAIALDLNSLNSVPNRNAGNKAFELNHANNNATFRIKVDPADGVVNTSGASYTDAQIEPFVSVRNNGVTVNTPGNRNFMGVGTVTLP